GILLNKRVKIPPDGGPNEAGTGGPQAGGGHQEPRICSGRASVRRPSGGSRRTATPSGRRAGSPAPARAGPHQELASRPAGSENDTMGPVNPRNHELARELARAISQLPLALQPAARRHVREYLADFARALPAGDSPAPFQAH